MPARDVHGFFTDVQAAGASPRVSLKSSMASLATSAYFQVARIAAAVLGAHEPRRAE
jgi:hypothetical protein